MKSAPGAPAGTRLSFTHERAEFRRDNALYDKTAPTTPRFERERSEVRARELDTLSLTEAERRRDALLTPEERAARDAFMESRKRPTPVLRPGPSLARSVERSQFDWDWRSQAERERADIVRQGLEVRGRYAAVKAEVSDQLRKTEHAADDQATRKAEFIAVRKLMRQFQILERDKQAFFDRTDEAMERDRRNRNRNRNR